MIDEWGTTAESYQIEQDQYLRSLASHVKLLEDEAKTAIEKLQACVKQRRIFATALFIIALMGLLYGFYCSLNG